MQRFSHGRTKALEIWIAASPTPNFFTLIRALAWTARRYGGAPGREADIVVVFGREAEPAAIAAAMPWANALGVRWRFTQPGVFERFGIFGTALDRFYGPFSAEMVLMLDADILIAAPLDGLVRKVLRDAPALWGLPAHIPPWPVGEDHWDALFSALGLGACPRGWRPSGHRIFPQAKGQRMPPYMNLGVLAAPRKMMEQVGQGMLDELAAVNTAVDSYYRCQLALCTRLCRLGAPARALSWRDNFPNDADIARRHRWAARRWRIVHILRRSPALDKQDDFASEPRLATWLRRSDLHGLAGRVQSLLLPLLAEIE